LKRIVLLILLLSAGCSQPDFRDTRGNGYRYEDYLGKNLVINYWAIWCGPCIKEIPELVALDENHEDIVVFGVNYDQPGPEMMAEQIADLSINFPVFDHDPYQHFDVDKPEVLPTTLIIGKDGKLQDVLVGPQTEQSLLDAIID
jgi:thiol-disulfide isomerase/thioredoxin